ncbi:MAG: nucleoside triphosphate pyrophosphohydrolase [Pseudomonadota bacterium]|nr:nucleoside triphosphate pyrophosphohydrolase [Pseudomonadota bacterium]
MKRLLDIMRALRDKQTGCPWDIEQTFASIAPYTIEEAYEVADAIDRGDMADLREELGDLLLQVVFHAQMASEQDAFTFDDVVAAICEKMTRRHPHVFAGAHIGSAEAQTAAWEAQKQAERQARGKPDDSALAGIARGLPEWQRAVKLQSRAARSGFDWPDYRPVLAKLREELHEVEAEFIARDAGQSARLEEELGDILFVAANLARHAGVDPGSALRHANHKFERRFRAMEAAAKSSGQSFADLTLQQQEQLWQQVKQQG